MMGQFDLTSSQRKLRDDLLDEPLSRFSDLELIDRFVEMAEKVYGEEINKILLETQGQEELPADEVESLELTVTGNRKGTPAPDFMYDASVRSGFDEWARYFLNGQVD